MTRRAALTVLGIESSCDETAAAVVGADGRVYADVVASQVEAHAPYGGVVPELASRLHLEQIDAVVARALAQASIEPSALDAVAVTVGPGLSGALLVGVSAARALAFAWDKPLVPVHHLEAHLLAVHLARDVEPPQVPYPYVALLVSGGHTALYRVDGPLAIELLGQTRDDAAGEAFDKAAKLLGLGYPGGPRVDRLARRGTPTEGAFPRPMRGRAGLEFSFAGLKTALARQLELGGQPADDATLADVCASYQAALVGSLVDRSLAACRETGVSRLVLTGGVAANSGLRREAASRCAEAGIELHVPPLASCTDNAAMVAYAGAMQLAAGHVRPDVRVFTRDERRTRGRFDRDGKLRAPPRP